MSLRDLKRIEYYVQLVDFKFIVCRTKKKAVRLARYANNSMVTRRVFRQGIPTFKNYTLREFA